MITDDKQANDELKPIADSNKIAWPDRSGPEIYRY